MRKSTHISVVGQKERSMFFNTLRSKIYEHKKISVKTCHNKFTFRHFINCLNTGRQTQWNVQATFC